MKNILIALITLFVVTTAQALSLGELSNKDAVGGLKEALAQGAGKAVDQLAKADGFLGNPKVKIPLPESLRQVAGMMRKLGMGKHADELETSMNRAAEAAMPEARTLLVSSIKQMSVQDAKGILTGGDDAATQYFKRATAEPLAGKFRPIVKKSIAKVNLAEKYDEFAGKAVKFGLVKEDQANLENYVTAKALDGLYLMIGEEERAIRKDPLGAAGSLSKKVFGALH
ncbi:MAG: DUF4197 domain-containing protein [Sterolibacterium sp.]|nr:DUF4197 domain-containing protein [Sterolibacterium sp.]